VVEDAAQSFGSEFRGTRCGTLGVISAFSFYPTKNLGALGDAGLLTTDDPNIAKRLQTLRVHGSEVKYFHKYIGYNMRLDELQAALLSALLPHVDADNERRREIIDRYAAAAVDGTAIVSSPHGTVGHLAVMLADDRDRLQTHLRERGVSTDIHFPILDCDQAGWASGDRRIGPGGLDISRRSVKRILSVPCFPEMTDDEVAQVCDALGSYSA